MIIHLSSQNQRLLAVAAPLLALGLSYYMVVPRYQTLKGDEQSLASTQAAIQAKQLSLAELSHTPAGPIIAHDPATPDEPVDFLYRLVTVARDCGVTMTNYQPAVADVVQPAPGTQNPPPPPVPGLPQQSDNAPPPNSPPANGGLPPGITPVALKLTFIGPYANMALFFGRLETYPRLISITNVEMRASKYPDITAEFKLTRYTGPAPAPPNPAPPGQ
jgi:hypothetical protein